MAYKYCPTCYERAESRAGSGEDKMWARDAVPDLGPPSIGDCAAGFQVCPRCEEKFEVDPEVARDLFDALAHDVAELKAAHDKAMTLVEPS